MHYRGEEITWGEMYARQEYFNDIIAGVGRQGVPRWASNIATITLPAPIKFIDRPGTYDIRGLDMSHVIKYATGTRRVIHIKDTIIDNITRFLLNLVHEDEDLR
jgi:hypothetical protein